MMGITVETNQEQNSRTTEKPQKQSGNSSGKKTEKIGGVPKRIILRPPLPQLRVQKIISPNKQRLNMWMNTIQRKRLTKKRMKSRKIRRKQTAI